MLHISNQVSIATAPGIGDFSWIYSLLVNLNRPLYVRYSPHNPERLSQFLKLLPSVKAWERGSARSVHLSHLKGRSKQDFLNTRSFINLDISLNKHLEKGKRLETFIGDLPTSFHYHIETSDKDRKKAESLGSYICLYASTNVWPGWGAKKWASFVEIVRQRLGRIRIVIVGAHWDNNLAGQIASLISENVVNLSGKLLLEETIDNTLRKILCLLSIRTGGVVHCRQNSRIYVLSITLDENDKRLGST